MADDIPTLPDYLRSGLDLVFVGINPGAYSASVGKYFATPQNRFWGALNRSGLVRGRSLARGRGLAGDRELVPGDEAWLFEHCAIGFTDVVKRASNSASSLRAADFRVWAPETREKLLAASPLVVCFNGITGYKWFLQYAEGRKQDDVPLGEQPDRLGASRVFVAPNPSPANASYSLQDIALWYSRLADLVTRIMAQRDG